VIALIDYGAGNQTSVRKALLAAGADVYTPSDPASLHSASAVVIPGVGHFAATASLDTTWRRAIADAIDAGTPLLGICLGMQWLFEGSDEEPGLAGLGYFAGRVRRLTSESWGSALDGPESRPADSSRALSREAGRHGESRPAEAGRHARVKIPHVGWNVIEARHRPADSSRALSREAGRHERTVGSGFSRTLDTLHPAFDALHGRYAYFTHAYAAPVTDECAGITTHGAPFAAATARGQVWGVQFHPEKSGQTGLTLLKAFVELARVRSPADST
jgi:glutamine amidotransferase